MNYSHTSTNLRFVLSVNNRVSISKENYNRQDYLLSIALLAHEIANLIGIEADYCRARRSLLVVQTETEVSSENKAKERGLTLLPLFKLLINLGSV